MTKIIYLTIDDAPSADCFNKLDYLDKHNIKAVWFAEGKRMEEYPHAAIEILKRGHIVGNHAVTHPRFSEIPLEQAYDEISTADAILDGIYRQAGVERRHRFFRFPYGDKGDYLRGTARQTRSTEGVTRHAAIQAYLRKLRYVQPAFSDITYKFYRELGLADDVDWFWTYDTFDWGPYFDHAHNTVDTVEKVLARLDEHEPEDWRGLNDPRSADIVLIHDHLTPENIFVQIIDKLIAKGVSFRLPVKP
jgi:peptidoglycan-N-acetylglucosamine deacetylase